MNQLREVRTYRFRHPCVVCGQLIKLCFHLKHFKLEHNEIDRKFYCYLCLQVHRPLGRHLKECADDINKGRRMPQIVLEGDRWYPWKRNWYKQYADEAAVMMPESLLHLFDDMPTYPKRYTSLTQTTTELKFRCTEGEGAVVKPLTLNETYFDTFVRWIINNDSMIYDENLKKVIQCLLEYCENKWYHLIVSQYHFRQFASLISNTGFTDFQCLCVVSEQETERTIHAHFLVHIDDFIAFKKNCWRKLLSPTSERYKMCTGIKDFFHMFNVIFYLSQKRACSDVRKTKHFDLKVHLSQEQENLTLLVFRRLFYNNVMNNFLNQASILRFDIYTVKDDKRNVHYVSPAKQIVKLIHRDITFENLQLQEIQGPPNSYCITFSGSGYLQLIYNADEPSRVTMADIIYAADKLENCWILWELHKVELIHIMLNVNGLKNTVAAYVDKYNIAFFGDRLRDEFNLPDEKEIAVHKLITKAAAKKVIVADNEQRDLITEIIGKSITTTVLPPRFILVEGKTCLDTAKYMYKLASHNA